MLGVPGSPGEIGWALLALAAVGFAATLLLLRHRLRREPRPVAASILAIVVSACATPYIVWRVVEDLRYTTTLHGYDAAAAGPVQAYLPGYLLDDVPRLIPLGATYATAVDPAIPRRTVRVAFPFLALQTLFPRRSVADPSRADYVVTLGLRPSRVAHTSRVWLARPASGGLPAVFVGRVEQ